MTDTSDCAAEFCIRIFEAKLYHFGYPKPKDALKHAGLHVFPKLLW